MYENIRIEEYIQVSLETARNIFWNMPLSLVYAWEHYHYRSNNVDTKRLGGEDDPIGGSAGGILTALSKIED